MPFSAGALCCVSRACVLLDVTGGETAEEWDRIPHVTNISIQQTANTQKLVTSSTGGRETSACGTVTQTGTLEIACHDGVGPAFLCVNNAYRIRWAPDCDIIWDSDTCEVIASPSGNFFEAIIRITTLPINYNIQGNAPIIYSYAFDIIGWTRTRSPDDYCQTTEQTGADVFDC